MVLKLGASILFSRQGVLSILLGALLPLSNYAQTASPPADDRWREAGLPYMRIYSASEYGGDQQNWDIVQDRRGVMYFANMGSLLEYDGVSWRQIYPPDKIPVFSLGIDTTGRIWVGAARDLGYLAPDTLGFFQFTSLMAHVPTQIREAETYWNVLVTSEGVYFRTRNVLLRWSESSRAMKIWRAKTGYGNSFVAEEKLYVRQMGEGLVRMEGDSLRLVPGGELFGYIDLPVSLPFPGAKQASDTSSGEFGDRTQNVNDDASRKLRLIVTYAQGLFVYDGVSFQPFKTEAEAFLQKNKVLCGAVLTDGNYALGTRHGGVAVIDVRGNLQLVLDKESGLPDNTVYKAYTDSQGGLWLGLNKGLARVELANPLTRHTRAPALQSGVSDVLRHQDKIYAATAEGVYLMKSNSPPGALPAFQAVAGLKTQCGKLCSAGSLLLVASHAGIYQIENDQAKLLKERGKALPLCFRRSRYDTTRVYVGHLGGLGLLQLQAGRWRFIGHVPGIHELVETIAEEGPDALWLTTRFGEAVRLSAPSMPLTSLLDSSTFKIERFDETHGLAKGWIKAFSINGKTLFTTNKGLRRFDPVSRAFSLEASFAGLFADTTWDFGGSKFEIDELGRIWTSRSGQFGMAAPKPDGSYAWDATPFLRFADFGEIWTFYIDEKHRGVYWFGGADGIIRYDETIAKDYSAGYPALIRRVIVNGDSIIYGGASMMKAPTLAYADNTLRFEYAAPYYDNEKANQYQFLMENFEDGWSDWTNETNVVYRHLPEGRYRFHVRARNIYQNFGDEAVFALEILPPWYRTWWSYALYGLMVFGAFYAIRRYELNRQQHKYQAELRHLEAKKLKELDKLKSDFFANISHEFRTPLTLILGPAEQLMEKQAGDDRKMLSLIRRNAQRLLQLINQLLDLSKLEHGGLPLQAAPGDFIAFLKGLVMSFESLAERKGIELRFEAQPSEGLKSSESYFESYFDHDKIETIFINLLSNAFKFTPEGGRVSVQLSVISEQLRQNSLITDHRLLNTDHWSLITVQDTGEGIPAKHLPLVFDRFHQVDSSSRRVHGGTGIGLALVKELVELHYGSIVVASEEGKGTTFTVCLPLGKEHLAPEQIVAAAITPQAAVFSEQFSEDDLLVAEQPATSRSEAEIPTWRDNQQSATNQEIILIIEDNTDVRSYIREQLQTDYAILEAADGEAGIARAITAIPDLVISDVMMPKKDGYEVCRTLKTDERTSHIPVILLTAKAGEKEKLAGFEIGADAYVLKPFRQDELAVRVRNLIALRRKLREKYSTATVIKPSEVQATSMDRAFLERVIAVIEANMGEEQFHAEALAGEVAMSLSQLNRKLNALIGQPAGHLIRSLRLQRAADLLDRNAGTVAEICYAVGFGDQANFTRSFKKQFGCSPSEYMSRSQKEKA